MAFRFELWRGEQRVSWHSPVYGDSGDLTQMFPVPNVRPASDYKLRVYSFWLENQGDPEPYDESDATFTILPGSWP
jgi:hypothetical protein